MERILEGRDVSVRIANPAHEFITPAGRLPPTLEIDFSDQGWHAPTLGAPGVHAIGLEHPAAREIRSIDFRESPIWCPWLWPSITFPPPAERQRCMKDPKPERKNSDLPCFEPGKRALRRADLIAGACL